MHGNKKRAPRVKRKERLLLFIKHPGVQQQQQQQQRRPKEISIKPPCARACTRSYTCTYVREQRHGKIARDTSRATHERASATSSPRLCCCLRRGRRSVVYTSRGGIRGSSDGGVSDYRSIWGKAGEEREVEREVMRWAYADDESIRFTSTFYRRRILSAHLAALHFHAHPRVCERERESKG